MWHIRQQNDARLRPEMPHLVLEGVVEHNASPCLPLECLVVYPDERILRCLNTEVDAQPPVGKTAMGGEVSPGLNFESMMAPARFTGSGSPSMMPAVTGNNAALFSTRIPASKNMSSSMSR